NRVSRKLRTRHTDRHGGSVHRQPPPRRLDKSFFQTICPFFSLARYLQLTRAMYGSRSADGSSMSTELNPCSSQNCALWTTRWKGSLVDWFASSAGQRPRFSGTENQTLDTARLLDMRLDLRRLCMVQRVLPGKVDHL